MKFFIITLLLFSLTQADEMKRIESIVDDITKLRVDYERCQKSLEGKTTLRVESKDERQKNIILKAEIEYLHETSLNNKKSLKNYKKLLKIKEKEILSLKKKLEIATKKSKKVKKAVITEVCKKRQEINSFPKLMPKNMPEDKTKERVRSFKASSFRLNIDSWLYDAPNGSKVDLWKKSTSFTSNKRSENWIKITGYFVKKAWVKAKKDIWIEEKKFPQR